MSFDLIDPFEFHFVGTRLRDLFRSKGLVEVPVQHRRSILAACEDPTTIVPYTFGGQTFPLPQTGQMWLEYEILEKRGRSSGFFCQSTSYREEKNPKPGRHNLIFPMMEFEIPGNINALQEFESEILQAFGYPSYPIRSENNEVPVGWPLKSGMGGQASFSTTISLGPGGYTQGDYNDVARFYGVEELEHEHEAALAADFGPAFFLKNFPFTTSPFWNMKADFTTKTANKIDVILSGVETIGSAERSTDPVAMREFFHTISGGQYARLLYQEFGQQRIDRELDAFLSHDFQVRSGGGIGVTRLIKSLKNEALMRETLTRDAVMREIV